MTQTSENLRRYLKTHCEEAFRAIVEDHLRLVYSAALRQVNGDTALASDISQMVFADLATKANTLPSNVLLSGWLYRHTCFTATKMLRAEHRRRTREREAVLMNTEDSTPEAAWDQIAPLLEEGMNSLCSMDRNAILLRFFEGKDLRAVGLALGGSDDAAQKRISRAIEKLRRFFLKKGVPVSGGVIMGVLAAHTSAAVPAGLVAVVTGSALAAGGVVAVSSFSGWFTQLMIMTKLKSLLIGTVVVAGVATPIILQHQAIVRLRSTNDALQQKLNQASATLPRETEPGPSAAESERLEKEHAELLRLRADAGRLRSQQQELMRLQEENKRLQATANNKTAPTANAAFVSSANWANVGFGSPLESLQTAHWAVRKGDIETFKQSMLFTESAKQFITNNMLAKMPQDMLAEVKKQGWGLEEALLFPMIAQDRNVGYKGYRVVSQDTPADNEMVLGVELELNSGEPQKKTMRFQRFGSDWRNVIDAADLQRMENESGSRGK